MYIPTQNELLKLGFKLTDHKWKKGEIEYYQNNWYNLERIEINEIKEVENLIFYKEYI